jgi:hypothetical protein
MLESFQLVVVAAAPLKATVPTVVPNPFPVIVTELPASAVPGDTPVITAPILNVTPLLLWPATLTTTSPLLAELGITTTMLLLLQLLGRTPFPAR